MTEPQINIPAKAYGFPDEAFDWTKLPDVDTNFLPPEHLEAFVQALTAPDPIQNNADDPSAIGSPAGLLSRNSFDVARRRNRTDDDQADGDLNPRSVAAQASAAAADVSAPGGAERRYSQQQQQQQQQPADRDNNRNLFITAANDWAPVHERVKSKSRRSKRRGPGAASTKAKKTAEAVLGVRSKDETREGYLYGLLKWPFLLIVSVWIFGLGLSYMATRLYIWTYEHFISWRGQKEKLRREMRATSNYQDWVVAAKKMDTYLGNDQWKEENEFAYYDSKTVERVYEQLRKVRAKAERAEAGELVNGGGQGSDKDKRHVEDLRVLIEACVKNNFVGVENPRLYSQSYYGTKNLVQNYVDELEKCVRLLNKTKQISLEEKRTLFKGIYANFGRTALCLSGGASFAYYHFGVVKALLEEDLLPDVITGTSGGALVAGLIATRTNDELKKLLVPALAHKITACSEPMSVWFKRWWRTGARFDSVDWAKQCSWWTRGSMTFREAYERTGRILNVSCVPADPHSPTILCNYLTSPDCVIWSAVLASAAVPGILNPVVLMMKTRSGQLVPYSFGHKWKDGSLRTDIPIRALNLHFNVNFTIVSQVNPHINLFFFSSRGSVGSPVTHRKGRGWRGGYLGSATEQYLKLDLNKWLKVLRHLELLPRPLGQDWSQIWLQQFVGTITVWPRSRASDFYYILSDPTPDRMARMIHEGQQSMFPKLKFVANRLKIERAVEQGRRETRPFVRRGSIETIISEDELKNLLRGQLVGGSATGTEDDSSDAEELVRRLDGAVLDNTDGESRVRFRGGERMKAE